MIDAPTLSPSTVPETRRLPGETGTVAPATDLADLDALFKGFADPTRLRVLNLLSAGELCVCDIVAILGLPQPAVSRHLAYLRRMGLVDATREWKFAHYRLAAPRNEAHRTMLQCLRSCFPGVPTLAAELERAEAHVAVRRGTPC